MPTVLCNSIVDDWRLCATGKEAPKQLQSAIQITRNFDGATPTKQMEKEVRQTAGQFGMKIESFEKQVGHPVTNKCNRDRTNQNKRTDEATRTVARIASTQMHGIRGPCATHCNECNPQVLAIACGMPSEQSQGALTSQIMRTLWPTGANMRSKEIVLAVLVKGHRIDPVQVCVYQILITLKTMLRSNGTWIPLWRRAWEAMQKRRVNQVQRDWRSMWTESSGGLGGHGKTRSR